MKPTKNRIFCVDAQRPKMLFETETAANRFIKFNSDEISRRNKKTPKRAYFCVACGGWHVTSQEKKAENYKSRTEQYLDRIVERNEAERIVNIAMIKVIDSLILLENRQRKFAEDLYNDAIQEIQYINTVHPKLTTSKFAVVKRLYPLYKEKNELTITDVFSDIETDSKIYSDMRWFLKRYKKKLEITNGYA